MRKAKDTFIILFFLVTPTVGCISSRDTGSVFSRREQRQALKDYAFCNCVSFALEKDSSIQNDISITAYHDISNYTKDAYDLIKTIAKSASDSIKPSVIADHEKQRGVLIDCLLFQRSKYLDSIVRSLDSKIVKF